jgi:hypothetical protein
MWSISIAFYALFLLPKYRAGPLWNEEGLMTYNQIRVSQKVSIVPAPTQKSRRRLKSWEINILVCMVCLREGIITINSEGNSDYLIISQMK